MTTSRKRDPEKIKREWIKARCIERFKVIDLKIKIQDRLKKKTESIDGDDS